MKCQKQRLDKAKCSCALYEGQGDFMKTTLISFVSLLIFTSSCSSGVKMIDEDIVVSQQRVACRPYCDDIEEIMIIYAGDKKYSHYGDLLANMVNNVASKKNGHRIDVPLIDFPVPRNWYPFRKNSVPVEIAVFEIGDKPKYLGVNVKMVTPAGVFSELSVCDVGGSRAEDVCVEESLAKFVSEAISGFLFDKGISRKAD